MLLVVRPQDIDLSAASGDSTLIQCLEPLHASGLRHVEVAWSEHPGWMGFIKSLKQRCPNFLLGAASVVHPEALDQIRSLDLSYSMAPVWNPELQQTARRQGQLLVPGVFSPSEVMQAIGAGYRIVKLFPAADLGCHYWGRLRAPLGTLPFVIAAGGLAFKDVSAWLSSGHGAVALGRSAMKSEGVDPALVHWLRQLTSKT
ncbi:hypothetical protein KR100_02885 [Synechococcus sp. KORDI-100]|nr:hypothetical protein KR100_02885 [Synechococcus sp. KORDI-100]